MIDQQFLAGSLLLVDKNISTVAHFKDKFPRETYCSAVNPLSSFKIQILNPLNFVQKCKGWDLTENTL